MKNLKLMLAVSILVVLTSVSKRPATLMVGEYGVCGYESSSTNYLKLKLNEDHTFHYIDQTNEKKPIDVKGTWKQEKNAIKLQDYVSEFPIHAKWKVDGEKCLKAKRGMSYYRLCSVKECK